MKIGTPFWHCKFLGLDIKTGIKTYDAPVKYYNKLNQVTINSSNSYLDTFKYGDKLERMWSMIADKKMFDGVFNEHDLFYVDGVEPNVQDENYVNGYGANAVAKPPQIQYKKIKIMLEQDESYQGQQ